MKKKALKSSIYREIYQSKARFFSILLIILLGVCFYAGIKATGPDMLNTANVYYEDYNLMDTKVISPLGLEDEDIELMRGTKGVSKVQPSYSVDVNDAAHNTLLRIMSYDKSEEALNKLLITKGRKPKESGEIVMDSLASELEIYKLGDEISVTSDDLTLEKITIVGFADSPMYIDGMSRGYTTIGKGTIDYFTYALTEDFDMDIFTEAYIQYNDTQNIPSYSSRYESAYKKQEKNLEKSLQERSETHFADVKAKAQTEINDATSDISEGEDKLSKAKELIKTMEADIASNKESIKQAKDAGFPVLESQEEELNQAQNKINDEKKKIETEQEKLEDAKVDVSKAKADLDKLTSSDYLYFSREDNSSYSEYEENAARLSSIATVFPVFFFMIAALISLTTMTRMVDEKRGEIGTLKALGYTNYEISLKYIVYASLASLVGSVLGLLIGFNVFPSVIFNAYRSMYRMPDVIITYYTSYSIQSIVVALLCTLLASLIVLRMDLLSSPSVLMRPKAPKPGKRILLERFTWLWSRLNFNQKVTARNLFRYKQRMLMTILGIAGCMAMIMTGFGVKDSIGDIVDLQFSKIWNYDATVSFDTDNEERDKYHDILLGKNNITETLELSQSTVTTVKKGYTAQEVTLDVPKDIDKLADFVLFNDRETKEVYQLDDEGVIINEKLGKLLDVAKGDTLTVSNSDNQLFDLKIAEVVENYAMHFIYMTPKYYEKIFNEEPTYNVELLQFKDSLTEDQENGLSEELMTSPYVMNVSYTRQIGKAMDDTMSSLDVVVWVLIVSAALLAFIVLYNLTNINISERIRELSTIKVLGFYDREVTMYVYRENTILTILGILLGYVLGWLLHGFVLETAEVDMLMFPSIIHPVSYLYSTLLTLLFSATVMAVMHRKLKNVNMIDALKSTE